MVIILDCGIGNLKSLKNAIDFLGFSNKITSLKEDIKKAKKIIFPGVGNFGKAILELKKRDILDILKDRIKEGVPFLGICLGMQLLFEESDESKGIKGLGLLNGRVLKFKLKTLVVPHMGWNSIDIKVKNKLLYKIKNNSYFYFAHSYYCNPKDKDIILTTTNYGIEFVSSIHKENIWAVQFHPEKSQDLGLKLLKNFLSLC